MNQERFPQGMRDVQSMPLFQALLGRRTRRFFMGAEISQGPLAHTSNFDPTPLSEIERALVVATVGGNTGWHNLIPYNETYQPDLPNYAGSATGRTFPSAAGFHTSQLFFTDDTGTYFLDTRDAPDLMGHGARADEDMAAFLSAHESRVTQLSGERLHLPTTPDHIESHNWWVVNKPGTLMVMPCFDLSLHMILGLMYFLQNRTVVFDDINNQPIPGIEEFSDIADVENPWPLSFVDQYTFMEAGVEIGCACYAGMLMLQPMGLGGWMLNGVNPFSILGASGDPAVPGLGFRYEVPEGAMVPHVLGLDGVMEGYLPPYYPDMAAAVDAAAERKFGTDGPFDPATPGPYVDSGAVRGGARPHDARFRACVALQCQYMLDTFGKFPATIPALMMFQYLQAHHLDTEYYDKHFGPGAYLPTHAEHMSRWHPDE